MRIGAVFAGILPVVLILGISVVSAQSGGPSATILSLDDTAFPILTFRLGIIDSTGRPITGLTPTAVEVLEDGQPAEVVSVSDMADDSQAIAVVIVIDTSDSMAGAPLDAAKQSAAAFVRGLGPTDQVAVLAFGSAVREVQPFTSDKAQAQAAIEQLQIGGRTALYDGANQGVLTAARSALGRRLVILLGDGAEYGGASLSQPRDAYEAARANGVTIHTIALGYNADTAYFRKLSGLTGGVALNAPTPDELDAQWEAISGLMRQLVVVVVQSNAPGDGQTHTLVVRVKTGGGQAEVSGTFKASAVPPKVNVAGLGSTLKDATAITANVDAQGKVTGVTFVLDGDVIARDSDSPWTAELDPASLAPGTHTLVVEATDESGTTGSTEIKFEVAALPPKVSLSLSEGQTIEAPLSITPDIASQADSNTVTVIVDGKTAETLTASPYRFTLDPAKLGNGAHTLAVTVTDSNGLSTSAEVGFTVVSAGVGGGSSPWIVAVAAVVIVALTAGAIFVRRKPATLAPASSPALRLEVLTGPDKGKVYPVTDEKQVIGRLSTAPIPLNDPTGGLHISREHARVWKSGGAAYIEDSGSRYDTTVNGRKITGPTALTNDALIKLGEVELIFRGPAPTAGDLRATRFEPGALPTLLAEPGPQSPATPPDKTMLIESEARITPPPAEKTVAEPSPQTEEEETRRTRLKAEPSAAAIESDEEEARHTRLKRDEDDEEMRQTRLKAKDGDDENRETRLKS